MPRYVLEPLHAQVLESLNAQVLEPLHAQVLEPLHAQALEPSHAQVLDRRVDIFVPSPAQVDDNACAVGHCGAQLL